MLNMACYLSSRARERHTRFNHPRKKKHNAKQGPCGPSGPCGPFSIVKNFVSLAVLFSFYRVPELTEFEQKNIGLNLP